MSKYVLYDNLSGYYYSNENYTILGSGQPYLVDSIIEAKVFNEAEKKKFPLGFANRERDVYLEFQELSDKQIFELSELQETIDALFHVGDKLSNMEGRNKDYCITKILEMLNENLDEQEKALAVKFLLH